VNVHREVTGLHREILSLHKEITGIHDKIGGQTKWLLSGILASASMISILTPVITKLLE